VREEYAKLNHEEEARESDLKVGKPKQKRDARGGITYHVMMNRYGKHDVRPC
jgi:hypothetical protein